jgi:hypothetical protein
MKARQFALGLFLALAATGSGRATEAVDAGQGSVSVWIYDYAGIDGETLSQAKERASRILGRARIDVLWVDCPLSAAEQAAYPGCKAELHPVRLVVRIRAGMPPDQRARARSAFGFAHVPHSGGAGFLADVYMPGADLLASGDIRERGSMLGHLIAHELGHLLLGTTRHAAKGIMRSPFTSREVERARQGALLFNTEEAKRLIANVRSRTQSIQ